MSRGWAGSLLLSQHAGQVLVSRGRAPGEPPPPGSVRMHSRLAPLWVHRLQGPSAFRCAHVRMTGCACRTAAVPPRTGHNLGCSLTPYTLQIRNKSYASAKPKTMTDDVWIEMINDTIIKVRLWTRKGAGRVGSVIRGSPSKVCPGWPAVPVLPTTQRSSRAQNAPTTKLLAVRCAPRPAAPCTPTPLPHPHTRHPIRRCRTPNRHNRQVAGLDAGDDEYDDDEAAAGEDGGVPPLTAGGAGGPPMTAGGGGAPASAATRLSRRTAGSRRAGSASMPPPPGTGIPPLPAPGPGLPPAVPGSGGGAPPGSGQGGTAAAMAGGGAPLSGPPGTYAPGVPGAGALTAPPPAMPGAAR